MEQVQQEEQRLALEESLKRAVAFESMIKSEGWEYVKRWYQNKIQHFASALLIQDKKEFSEFESERRELIGIRKLMGIIDNDLKTLHDQEKMNEKDTKSAKE